MLELFFSMLAGLLLGMLSGLFPELHPNLLAPLLALSISDPGIVAVLLISMLVTSSVLDSIPAVFMGTPNPDSGIALLPTHKLVAKGFGTDAVRFSVLGSLLGLLFAFLFVPLLAYVLPLVYASLRPFVVFVLCGLVFFFVLKETGMKKFWALFVFASAGILGFVVLNSTLPEPLTVLFSGLFAVPNLLLSLLKKSVLPAQTTASIVHVSPIRAVLSTVGALLAGFVLVLVPSTSPSHAAYAARVFAREPKQYLILQGALRSIDGVFSLVGLLVLHNARNGVVAVLKGTLVVTSDQVWFLIGIALVCGGIAALVCAWLVVRIPSILTRLKYERVCVVLLFLICSLVLYFSGVMGLLVMMLATAIGLTAILTGISRSHCMGVLLVPTIRYFL